MCCWWYRRMFFLFFCSFKQCIVSNILLRFCWDYTGRSALGQVEACHQNRIMYVGFRELIWLRSFQSYVRPHSANKWTQSFSRNENVQLGNWCHCATLVLYMWVGSRNCGCLVAWLCYQFMAKPGSRTAAVPWPGPYVFTVYMTHRLSVYILYWHTNAALILVTSYLHIHF